MNTVFPLNFLGKQNENYWSTAPITLSEEPTFAILYVWSFSPTILTKAFPKNLN